MRGTALIVLLLWLAGFGAAAGPSVTTGKGGAPAKKEVSPKSKGAPLKRKAASKKVSIRGRKAASRGKRVPSWRRGQQAPTPERNREIQQVLAERGYLRTAPTGVWDEESVEALRRFQKDQHLEPTGKLDSLSLIALGLGPKRSLSAQDGRQPPPERGNDDDHRSTQGSQGP